MRTDCPTCGKLVIVHLDILSVSRHSEVELSIDSVLDYTGAEHHCPTREELPLAA